MPALIAARLLRLRAFRACKNGIRRNWPGQISQSHIARDKKTSERSENHGAPPFRTATLWARNDDKGAKPKPGSITTSKVRADIRGGSVNLARRRPWTNAFSTEALCMRILERHRASIRVQKPRIAVANLTRIIGATLTLSNKQGFHATTLRQLAEASGLSMGGLYTYIDSKPRLLSMILGEVAATATEVLTAPPNEVRNDAHKHLDWI